MKTGKGYRYKPAMHGWLVEFMRNGKKFYIGVFHDEELAAQVAAEAIAAPDDEIPAIREKYKPGKHVPANRPTPVPAAPRPAPEESVALSIPVLTIPDTLPVGPSQLFGLLEAALTSQEKADRAYEAYDYAHVESMRSWACFDNELRRTRTTLPAFEPERI